jgi:hypothetical protein
MERLTLSGFDVFYDGAEQVDSRCRVNSPQGWWNHFLGVRLHHSDKSEGTQVLASPLSADIRVWVVSV